MVPRLALSVLAARTLARRPAVVVVTSSVQGALAVVYTLASGAANERVSPMSGRTSADRSVCPGPVKPSLALGTGTARVGVAEILLLELTAADERVSSISPGTRAHRLVVRGLTVGAVSAHVRVWVIARVAAFQPNTGLV